MGAALAQYSLLVGSKVFLESASRDMLRATRRLLVQAMTFEADSAGNAVARAIISSGSADRRVLVDSFSRMVISDSFVVSPRFLIDANFRGEVRDTRKLFRELPAQGIGVRTTNPVGLNPLRYGARNHKKLIVADDAVYIGGINFSDHNFGWHDLMLRVEDPEIADFFATDFDASWAGEPVPSNAGIGDASLHALDGRHNQEGFRPLFAAIESAVQSIIVVSPYLTFPFTEALAAARGRGVRVQLLAPLANNKPLVRDYLLDTAAKAQLEMQLMPEMSHLKAMLIDDRRLVLGSTNFDFASYWASEELYAIIDNVALAEQFVTRVIKPALVGAVDGSTYPVTRWHVKRANVLLSLAEAAVKLVRNTSRTSVNWK